MTLASIPTVVETLRAGRPVIVADDEGRENEGDVVIAAQLATAESIAWMVHHTSGLICAPMTDAIADRLELQRMVRVNEDPRGTAYTVTVDASDRLSTGISAADRAHTLNVLADPRSTPSSVARPGHVLPLRAVPGGVRRRGGHTEAAVDLMLLAGVTPVAAIAEITGADGTMLRLPALEALGAEHDVPVTTVAALIAYLDAEPALAGQAGVAAQAAPPRVSFQIETLLPTRHGPFRVRAYRDALTGDEHVALVAGDPVAAGALVRVHSECLTGESFGSLKCECGAQLLASLDAVQAEGGVVVYLRGQEGRGIGLIDKLRAYRLQEDGLDTVDANLALGLPVDAREYAAAAAILRDLGITGIRLLTNNPDKVAQLTANGIEVIEQVPLVVGVGPSNADYLRTKRDRMAHRLDSRLLSIDGSGR